MQAGSCDKFRHSFDSIYRPKPAKNTLTTSLECSIVLKNLIRQTDEAEVTAVMRAQRVREGESRVEMQIVKWAAEGAVKGSEAAAEYSAT